MLSLATIETQRQSLLLTVGFGAIRSFGICGDADGGGDPGNVDPTSNGLLFAGLDLPDLGQSETFTMFVDTGETRFFSLSI